MKLSYLLFAVVVSAWCYLLSILHVSPDTEIVFLILSGYLYLQTKYKCRLIFYLAVFAPLRFYTQVYLGSIWGLLDQVKIHDLQFILDSIFPTLILNNTNLLTGLIVIELCLIGLIFLNDIPFKNGRIFSYVQKIYPLVCICACVFFYQQQSRLNEKNLVYQKLDKNKYYFGTNTLVTNSQSDLKIFKNKNLILFILESVGEKEYASERVIKIRNEIQKKFELSSITYPNVINVFPGTTRSHLAIHTGGLALTTGSLSEEIVEMKAPPHLSLSFSTANYKTAIFSAAKWEFENLNVFYEKLKWDTIFDQTKISSATRRILKQNSWGYDEILFLNELKKWFNQNLSNKKMAVFINNNTHHPYEATVNHIYDLPYDKYSKAVDESLKLIETTIENLQKQGQLKNTVIAITGDHGEAFGNPHSTNFLHRNFLYEENIHNFLDLLYHDDQKISQSLRTNTISQGDIYPTLISLFDLEKNLSPSFSYYDYKQKLIFFHKNATPEKWGLRDSEWKYIESRYNQNSRELYNLTDDPFEQNNIVYTYPERAKLYRQLIAEWFVEKRNEFYTSTGLILSIDQLNDGDYLNTVVNPGIQNVFLVPAINIRESYSLQEVSAKSPWALLLKSHPRSERRSIDLLFTSPSKKKYIMKQPIFSEWGRIWVIPNLPQPVETGQWQLKIIDEKKQLVFNFTLI